MSPAIPPDFDLDSYDYPLPEDRIAQSPAAERDASRLLVLDRAAGTVREAAFRDLPRLLPPGALLAANNTTVLPARLLGRKPSGGRLEFLLLTPLPCLSPEPGPDGTQQAEAEGLLRAKGIGPGGEARFHEDLGLRVLETGEFGRCRVRLEWRGDLAALFRRLGHMPLPPYIRRPDTAEDAARYQTVYASPERTGSVAAPTAGLHFTPGLRRELAEAGFGWAEVSLYVGYGTFSPVRCRDIRRHVMHAEYVEVDPAAARAVGEAKAAGRPVVCVGTTAVRALEGVCAAAGGVSPFRGWTDLFITPGFRFRATDHLLTNFHLPRSSLLVLLAAFAGRQQVLDAYAWALERDFRVFSYGDAMLVL